MSNVTNDLVKLADNLDTNQLTKIADKVDGINRRVLDIKKAQYIGFQGYWMRNRRCWENCYREKRARTNKPAQEVWAECHKEYLESLNKDESEWDKYADSEVDGLIKNASRQVINQEDEKFRKELEQKKAEGFDTPTAVFSVIDDNLSSSSEQLIEEANKLASVATQLKKQKKRDLAKVASDATVSLIKEAQFSGGSWANPSNWKQKAEETFQGFFSEGRLVNIGKRLERAQQAAQKALNYFPPNGKFRDQESYDAAMNAFMDFQRNISRDLQEIRQMAEKGENPAAMDIYSQHVLPVYQAMQQIDNPQSYQPALRRIDNSLEQAINKINEYLNQGQDAGQQQQQQQPAEQEEQIEQQNEMQQDESLGNAVRSDFDSALSTISDPNSPARDKFYQALQNKGLVPRQASTHHKNKTALTYNVTKSAAINFNQFINQDGGEQLANEVAEVLAEMKSSNPDQFNQYANELGIPSVDESKQEEAEEQTEEEESEQEQSVSQDSQEIANFLDDLLSRTQQASSNKTSISQNQVKKLLDWFSNAYGVSSQQNEDQQGSQQVNMQQPAAAASSTRKYHKNKYASVPLDRDSKQWVSKIKRNFNNVC